MERGTRNAERMRGLPIASVRSALRIPRSAFGLAASPGFAPGPSGSKPGMLLLHHEAVNWWPARVTRPVLRIKSPLHHFNACKPNWCSRQELHLHWRRSRRRASALGYASCLRSATKMEPPAGAAPAGLLYKRNPQAAAWRRKWSQSPVLPWTQRAYETHLRAGSTAVLANGPKTMEPPPGVAPG